jgi:hypothetical protein
VCGECFRYVGSVEHQIARRLLSEANGGAAAGDDNAIVDPGTLRLLLSGETRLPGRGLGFRV